MSQRERIAVMRMLKFPLKTVLLKMMKDPEQSSLGFVGAGKGDNPRDLYWHRGVNGRDTGSSYSSREPVSTANNINFPENRLGRANLAA